MSTPLAVFGPGILIATRTDIAGSPINVGFSQGLEYSEKASVKGLNGQSLYPIAFGKGPVKPALKFTAAALSGLAWNAMYYGQTFSSGGIEWNVGEAFSVPATSPYTYQAVNHATFDIDLGVTYAASGLPLQRVSSGPTVGQYSVSAGTYTFAAADEGAAMLVTYTSTVTTGQTLLVQNQQIGNLPTFQLDYYTSLNQPTAKPFVARFFYCVASGLTLASKMEDFSMPQFELMCGALPSGKVYELVYPEVS